MKRPRNRKPGPSTRIEDRRGEYGPPLSLATFPAPRSKRLPPRRPRGAKLSRTRAEATAPKAAPGPVAKQSPTGFQLPGPEAP